MRGPSWPHRNGTFGCCQERHLPDTCGRGLSAEFKGEPDAVPAERVPAGHTPPGVRRGVRQPPAGAYRAAQWNDVPALVALPEGVLRVGTMLLTLLPGISRDPHPRTAWSSYPPSGSPAGGRWAGTPELLRRRRGSDLDLDLGDDGPRLLATPGAGDQDRHPQAATGLPALTRLRVISGRSWTDVEDGHGLVVKSIPDAVGTAVG
jgi:hypothetical protein